MQEPRRPWSQAAPERREGKEITHCFCVYEIVEGLQGSRQLRNGNRRVEIIQQGRPHSRHHCPCRAVSRLIPPQNQTLKWLRNPAFLLLISSQPIDSIYASTSLCNTVRVQGSTTLLRQAVKYNDISLCRAAEAEPLRLPSRWGLPEVSSYPWPEKHIERNEGSVANIAMNGVLNNVVWKEQAAVFRGGGSAGKHQQVRGGGSAGGLASLTSRRQELRCVLQGLVDVVQPVGRLHATPPLRQCWAEASRTVMQNNQLWAEGEGI